MFKSKTRPINIPQYEHGLVAGNFASLWGNKKFDRPAVEFTSFVQGVTLHDWHYGVIDDLAISEASEANWLEMVAKGVETWFDDPIVDIVAKLHIKRLLSGRGTPEVERLVDLVELRIAGRLPQTNFTRDQFVWADKITRFCDDLAFHFCFEETVIKTRSLYNKVGAGEDTTITFQIGANGQILVDPWPFSPPSFSGILIGYKRSGYPETLQPIVIPYNCQPENTT